MPAKLAKGTYIQVETSEGSGVYATIPLQTNVQGPEMSSTEHNVSSADTPGLVMEFLGGMVDPGRVSFQIWEDVSIALHRQLDSDAQTADPSGAGLYQRNYKKVWPTGYTRLFRAYVRRYGPQHGVDAPHQSSVELRLTAVPGPITAP